MLQILKLDEQFFRNLINVAFVQLLQNGAGGRYILCWGIPPIPVQRFRNRQGFQHVQNLFHICLRSLFFLLFFFGCSIKRAVWGMDKSALLLLDGAGTFCLFTSRSLRQISLFICC
ncbi:hypothetical protein H8S45_15010 [Agathobaculum sp. NSJ-28]|uniref:Uncharacterized protein n=1 Tax=Agathobaculum faecis TaxID=2763013 RepID=A0A923LZB8_9FIRM|nr:hypothetical protein [Agathobaculum faecis]MBC5726757.1 hypothetical protein [Agathobaculum faecis]